MEIIYNEYLLLKNLLVTFLCDFEILPIADEKKEVLFIAKKETFKLL